MHLYFYVLRNIPRVILSNFFSPMLVKNTFYLFVCKHCLHRPWKIKLLLNDHKFQIMGLRLNEVLLCRIRNVNSMATESWLFLLQQVALTLKPSFHKILGHSKSDDI